MSLRRLTEQSKKVLAAIHVAQRLASMLAVARLDLLVDFVELRSFEAVEKDAP